MTKLLSRQNLAFVSLLGLMFMTAFAVFTLPQPAKANPSQTPPYKGISVASTSPVYMSAATSTRTITYDSFSVGSDTKFDSALIVGQYTASSSADTLRFRVEYSRDGIDWYPDNTVGLNNTALNSNATTTQLTGTGSSFFVQPATTSAITDGFQGSGTATRVHFSAQVSWKARWMRVIYWNRVGEGNGAVYSEILPIKEKY